MQSSEKTRTIQDARSELKKWGKYWREYGTSISSGGSLFASIVLRSQRSNSKYHTRRRVGKCDERANMPDGLTRPVSAHCLPTQSSVAYHDKEVFVPWSIRDLDEFVETMQKECRSALRKRYIENQKNYRTIWLDRAEKLVMLRV